MLGKRISDPDNIESASKSVEGIGLLDIETTFTGKKITCRVEAELADSSWLPVKSREPLRGYEIHMGQSSGDIGLFKMRRSAPEGLFMDGSVNKNCWGTYIHGIFENDLFRRSIINKLRMQKGLGPVNEVHSYSLIKDRALDSLAGIVSENVDMEFIVRLVGL